MINKLRNTPVRELIRALEQDGFQYKRRKGSQRVYRHYDGVELLFTIIMQKIPFLLELFGVSSREQSGMEMI